MTKWVYQFGIKTEGNASQRELLGGKGANLAEMASLGLPVPPGFTISTQVCTHYYKNQHVIDKEILQQIQNALTNLEQQLHLKFGDITNPLLVSVRSGARASMPGMMDTILNVGLNDQTVEGLAAKTNNKRFAYDSYRRLISMYCDVVLGISKDEFEKILNRYLKASFLNDERLLSEHQLKELIKQYKDFIVSQGKEFPQDVNVQLHTSIEAVFKSWMNPRAQKYRQIHNIPADWGTAVNVQSMVFGNYGETSATGVCFSRDPASGENVFYGEFLLNAQGEDVVSGVRSPHQITIEGKRKNFIDEPSLEELMPPVYKQLLDCSKLLEQHFSDVQDIEFTIQKGKLWILQTRIAKRSPTAAIKLAVQMHKEGLISKETAILRIPPLDIEQLLHPTLDTSSTNHTKLSKGLPASPGAASGMLCFTAAEAEGKYKGKNTILVRAETSPEDIGGMYCAQGVLTACGGMTSHAAVVARGMGKPCVVGANELNIDEVTKTIKIKDTLLKEGDYITINGTTGDIILGEAKTKPAVLSTDMLELLSWCDEIRKLDVRANADTPNDALVARQFGASGIGLCRTEHMFFAKDRILSVRKMIFGLSEGGDLTTSLQELFNYQKTDFTNLFKVMKGLPITIRLLDPPLHEFLPTNEHEIKEFAQALGLSFHEVNAKIHSLKEMNPMLGHRGCRLAISHPMIYKMQLQAIMEAACELEHPCHLEIMIPLVQDVNELIYLKQQVMEVEKEIEVKYGKIPVYSFGTMIELPRAALKAQELGEIAQFFSFGTNDLTQTTIGISRDDANKFLPYYLDKKIFMADPFATIDVEGVGEIIQLACERGRISNPKIKLGVCGEHGGDPKSIEFFHQVGLNYVSCSPYRVPVARLAAAQAHIKSSQVA